MERALSIEERIKRAEEIYERRKNENYRANTATVNVSGNNKDFSLLKKMFIQILICLLIYFIFYLIQTTNYVFSASTISKTKEILEYDMDVQGIYNDIKNNFINNEDIVGDNENINEEQNSIEENVAEEQKSEEIINNEAKIEDTEIEQIQNNEQEVVNIQENITIAQEILNKYSIIKPTDKGFISSEFGTREPEGDIVTAVHKGIDIGVVTGTEVKSAIDGEVIISTESESYGRYIKIKNDNLETVYAHCSELLFNVGDIVKQGDVIAKSGATGKVTGPHLHFEIIYNGEYINPREVLEF